MSTICSPRESSGKTVRPARTTPRRRSSRRRSTTSTRSTRRRRPPTTPRATSCRRRERPMRRRPAIPPSNRPPSMVRAASPRCREAARGDYGLSKQDLPILTTGATGIAGKLARYPHPRRRQPAERPLSAGDAAAGRGRNLEPLQDLRRQPGASLLSDVAGTRLRRRQGHQPQSERMPGRPVPVCRDDGLLRQQRQSDADAARGRRYRDGLLQRRQGRRALSDASSPASTRSTTTTIRR